MPVSDSWRRRLDFLATLAILACSTSYLWSNWASRSGGSRNRRDHAPAFKIPDEPVPIKGAAQMGSEQAPLVLVEYSDFQCPFCATFVKQTLPALDNEYIKPGKVLLVFRHLPVESLHPMAVSAAHAADCAQQVGRFWDMHDALFKRGSGDGLTDARISELAASIGLETASFDSCRRRTVSAPLADVVSARNYGIAGTPAFVVGRRIDSQTMRVATIIAGAQSFDRFKEAIDKALSGGI